MKALLLTGFFSITWLLACQDEKLDWGTLEISPDDNFPAIDSSQWSYRWFMREHKGHFENIASDTILPQDIIPLFHNSTCVTSLWPGTLPFCRVTLKNNALALEIYHEGADGYVGLKAWVWGHKFKYQYESSTPAAGIDSMQEQFEIQKLMLNTDQWHKGAIVKGKVEVHWKRIFQNGKIAEESIKGNFEAVIE